MKEIKSSGRERKKRSCLTYNDRLLDRLIRENYHKKEIAKMLCCCLATVYNELNRAVYKHLNSDYKKGTRYNPDMAQERYERNLRCRGSDLKTGNDYELAKFIERKIVNEHYSPNAVLLEIKEKYLEFKTDIKSVNIIYSYIEKGIFERLRMKHLPQRGKRRKRKKRKIVIQKRSIRGESI